MTKTDIMKDFLKKAVLPVVVALFLYSIFKTTVTPQNMCKDCLHIIIACSLSVMIRCLALW